jgi:hypothetical protein
MWGGGGHGAPASQGPPFLNHSDPSPRKDDKYWLLIALGQMTSNHSVDLHFLVWKELDPIFSLPTQEMKIGSGDG